MKRGFFRECGRHERGGGDDGDGSGGEWWRRLYDMHGPPRKCRLLQWSYNVYSDDPLRQSYSVIYERYYFTKYLSI